MNFGHETPKTSFVRSQSIALVVFTMGCVVRFHVTHLTEV